MSARNSAKIIVATDLVKPEQVRVLVEHYEPRLGVPDSTFRTKEGRQLDLNGWPGLVESWLKHLQV